MSLTQKLEKDYIEAFKAKMTVKVTVLRLLKTVIKNQQVELQRPLEDSEVLDLVAKQAKQRKESIVQFEKAGRDDLAAVEIEELALLEEYLPEQMSEEQLKEAVDSIADEIGASSMADMGKIMSALTAKFKGQYDGKTASTLVRARLSN
ncbi:MAG: GatB/YqeY domain-containing protein [Desulfovibrio sp.]